MSLPYTNIDTTTTSTSVLRGSEMKVLLDAKDLIDVIEHSRPISANDLGSWLQSKGAQLVLSYTNVRELAAPIATRQDILGTRALLNKLESLPVCYIREGYILRDELKAAMGAFENRREPDTIDPFVRRWDYTFHDGESPAKHFVAYSIFEIVHTIAKRDPQLLLSRKALAERLRLQFAAERQMAAGVKKTAAQNFPDSVARHLTARGLPLPNAGVEVFGKWIYADQRRCPGLRLAYEMYHSIQANVTDVPKDGDIPDLAHIYAIPYVDHITVDRRMCGYSRCVAKKLFKANPVVNYEPRLAASLEELLRML